LTQIVTTAEAINKQNKQRQNHKYGQPEPGGQKNELPFAKGLRNRISVLDYCIHDAIRLTDRRSAEFLITDAANNIIKSTPFQGNTIAICKNRLG
jgi:hypothetical protein